MKRKIVALLLMFYMLPISIAYAQWGSYTANGVTWQYSLEGSPLTATIRPSAAYSGVINIPDHIVRGGISYPVTQIGEEAFYYNKDITSLTIPATVKIIGKKAFSYCSNLTGNLSLPNVTEIGYEAFCNCDRYTGGSLSLPNVVKIGSNAFRACYLSGTLSIPNVTEIGDLAFCYNYFTGDLSLPNVTKIEPFAFQFAGFTGTLSLPNVTEIGNDAFSTCGFTGSLSLPNVTEIGNNAFMMCDKFTGTLSVPKLTKVGESAFEDCEGFTGSLSLPNVTEIGRSAFNGCRHFTGSLSLPKVTKIGAYAFGICMSLTDISSLPNVTEIGEGAFENCIGFAGTITFSNITLSHVGSHIFHRCYNLTAIDMRQVTLPTGTTISRNTYPSPFRDLSPYTMIYLPATVTAAEANQENFVIGNQCDKFVVYERHNDYKDGNMGCDYPILQDFTATTAEYRDRNFSGTTYKTLCLPYPATLPAGMRAYKLKQKAGDGVRFVSIGDGGTQLEANTPYLLRVTDGGTHTFGTENNVQVKATPATIEIQGSHDASIFFGGTTTNIGNAAAASGNYYGLYSNTWLPYKPSTPNGFVHSMRAYIRTTGGSPAKGFAIVLDDEETATGIDTPELTEDELRSSQHTFYTLDGRQAGTDYDRLISGEIYVVKGQKFYKF